MKDYHVEWRIEISADTPEQAARLAHAMRMNPGTWANVYHVAAEGEEHEPVDLAEIGEAKLEPEPEPVKRIFRVEVTNKLTVRRTRLYEVEATNDKDAEVIAIDLAEDGEQPLKVADEVMDASSFSAVVVGSGA